MPFEHAAFLSYRVGAEPGVNSLYRAFRQELAQQVDLYMPGLGVYLDQERLQGGDFYNSELAHALCHSVCMVVLFSPQYFDTEHTYCAREYQAMVRLEERRLSQSQDISKGLIVPVVIRGTLPQEISEQRHYFSLSEHLLAAGDLRLKAVRRVLRSIAELIYQRYQYLKPLEQELCGLCQGFAFPSVDDVSPMIHGYTARPKAMLWR
jgi:TIR domain